jgi:hypothetical protein
MPPAPPVPAVPPVLGNPPIIIIPPVALPPVLTPPVALPPVAVPPVLGTPPVAVKLPPALGVPPVLGRPPVVITLPPALSAPPVLGTPPTLVLPPLLVVAVPPVPPVGFSGVQPGSQSTSPIRETHLIVNMRMIPLLPMASRLLAPSSREVQRSSSVDACRPSVGKTTAVTDRRVSDRARGLNA